MNGADLSEHRVEWTFHGADAQALEASGRAALASYFGDDLTGVEWSVSSEAQINLTGRVMGYVATVSATRRVLSPT